MSSPRVTLVVCGAPLTARTADLASELTGQGWTVSVVGTPSSTAWLDVPSVARVTGEGPRLDFRLPSEPRQGTPTAIVVCPATFNTINKAALGLADSFATSIICEALGGGVPTLITPMVNNKLWGHPSWVGNLQVLLRAGVVLVDVLSGGRVPAPVPSGTGSQVVADFDPKWITAALGRP